MLKRYFLYLPLLAYMGLAQADAALKAKLEALLPGMTVESMTPLEDTGLYEAVVNGEIVYFSKDGLYLFQGDVISLASRQNITENKRVDMKKALLAALNEDDMIVFEPKHTEHTLTVFTDIDCGYCRKLHQQMSEYNDLGIKIRYMAFPRSGPDSDSFDKAVNVWCAKDRQQAMTDSKLGTNLASKTCDNPVAAHFEAGRRLGVTGTPALFLESGQMLPGYIPPKRLKQMLDEPLS
jgi:thiol:disulfide interchange protein DsbC